MAKLVFLQVYFPRYPSFRAVLFFFQTEEHLILGLNLSTLYPGRATMSTTGLQATNQQNVKEIDSVKESISDIINQLQDIDPARLSFSPFLDLDTQISLAPVSDSPESSVEELHSSSHSVTGSQRSLEPLPTTDQPRSELLLLFLTLQCGHRFGGETGSVGRAFVKSRPGPTGDETKLGLRLERI